MEIWFFASLQVCSQQKTKQKSALSYPSQSANLKIIHPLCVVLLFYYLTNVSFWSSKGDGSLLSTLFAIFNFRRVALKNKLLAKL